MIDASAEVGKLITRLSEVQTQRDTARRERDEAQAEAARLKSGGWIPVEQLPPMTRHGIKASDLFLVQAKGYGRIVACYDFDSGFWRSWPNSGGLAEVYAYMPLPPEYEPPTPTPASVPAEPESAAVPAAVGLLSEDVSGEGENQL